MIKRLWEKLTGIDRLKHEIKRLREARDANFESMVRANDRAYDRRQILKAIAACETPGANGTVKRMAKLARAGLEMHHFADTVRERATVVAGNGVSEKVEYIGAGQINLVSGDVHHVVPTICYSTGGGGGLTVPEWQPGAEPTGEEAK